MFSDNYLKHTYEHVRAAGGVCIADEVQSGFGRRERITGVRDAGRDPGHRLHGKRDGNGAPLGGSSQREDRGGLSQGIHFNTFGATVATRKAGVLEVELEKLQENALRIGNSFHGLIAEEQQRDR